ncbi:class I SAM-dependent methyltransferase [Algoriphagus yeomjeoni]|uniref:class I SAM-dependent methyltransferase n=1 Tax=Algoriphagus yeomjeoni TaxID=291403 RepID=UPI003CE58E38
MNISKILKLKKKLIRQYYSFKYPLIPYSPEKFVKPEKVLTYKSGWSGLELIIEDILEMFDIERESCIEFGVEFGFSSVVFSNYFEQVKGIDTFFGDTHTDHKGDHYKETKESLREYPNIELIKSNYQDWIKLDKSNYDFAHVDIVHNYKETFECGLWAVRHSKCCIFHDTESFPEVRKAVFDIAKVTGKKAYNYPKNFGLGIIV